MTSKTLPLLVAVCAIYINSAIPASAASKETLNEAKQIDKLIRDDWARLKLKPTRKTTDQEFLRRVYLDIAGRIPNYQEAQSFLDSKDPKKRSKLIDKLLDGPGYASNMFNFWADILRLRTRNRNDAGGFYIEWVKKAIADNMPYDKMVYEMLTAKGMTRDNGAAGYLITDADMPLDNASLTAQTFLGTQIGCAQCHDHPFDKWTQLDFYQFAAFTASTNTRQQVFRAAMSSEQMKKMSFAERRKRMEQFRGFREKIGELPNMQQNMIRQMIRANSYAVSDTDRPLRLPKDYKYEDGKPDQAVEPKVIFGDTPSEDAAGTQREKFARWLVAPDNPRFAKTIANRLWKRIMGIGLVEPVDDFTDDTKPQNPELLDYLTQLMVRKGFDLKEYERVLFNSETYQLSAATEEIAPEDYHAQAGVLRRMQAEEIWDSLLSIALPDLDTRKGFNNPGGYMGRMTSLARIDVRGLSPDELIEKVKEATSRDRRDARNFRDMKQRFKGAPGAPGGPRRPAGGGPMTMQDRRRAGIMQMLSRASEMPSPMPDGTFLSQFGQSTREAPHGASTEPSVPQALQLLNGRETGLLMMPQSQLIRNIRSKNSQREHVQVIYLSILSRYPTQDEMQIALNEVQQNRHKGYANLIWALVNSREFIFVQ